MLYENQNNTVLINTEEGQKFLEDSCSAFKEQIDYNSPAKQYLYKRGYREEQIRKFEVGIYFCKETILEYLISNGHDETRFDYLFKNNQGNIVFTVRNHHKKIEGFIFRRPDEQKQKYFFSKGFSKSNNLFNIHNLNKKKVVIVEGVFDVFAGTCLADPQIEKEYCFV